ncbi:catechol 2,3-dioxygenase-like lactoylglutathione lyase family enzyme [Scopulibacillus daqui]|uniref:Catechol 2,3-dioxygenase-like lactoylglutathione lyase family enzyme n=1 Tax=Scopulibacillus daqui TaxID=1469162 RepID=A0ABS2PXW3_9BACL|nr:VOC family protein [Scopulibacillus daqui]MBM7644893.1 catechol 2,3-dioxygenase-like lactoylglutathione lyase family enzyme [Scopulibacillus daqui]
MIGVTHLRHVSLITPSLSEQSQYYEKVWGLDKVYESGDSVYFRGASPENHILSLHAGEKKRLHHIAFGMVDKNAVDEAAETLASLNVPIVSPPGYLDEAGGGYGLRFVDPDGRCIELSAWVDIHTTDWKKKSVDPMKLNHVVLNTVDIDRAVDFYTKVLGFKVSDWSEHQMAFIRCNKNHHSISFNQAAHNSVNHIAYEVDGVDEVMRGIRNVREAGYEIMWGPGRHGPGNNIFCYFTDPAGFVIEYTCYLISIEEESEWEALVWKRVPHLMDRWGVAGPPSKEARAFMAGEPDEGWALKQYQYQNK